VNELTNHQRLRLQKVAVQLVRLSREARNITGPDLVPVPEQTLQAVEQSTEALLTMTKCHAK
jgi:hypothetical protein